MLLALIYPILLGLNRIETAKLLRSNGTFQYLTGLPRCPAPQTLRRFLRKAPARLREQLHRVNDRLLERFIHWPEHRSRLIFDLDATSLLGWGVSLWIAATDADVLHAQLSEAAVPIVLPLANGPFGRFFAFRDPDGYTVTVSTAQPKIARAVLDPKDSYLTFINTFTVEPDNAERLLQALRDATEEIFRHQPGFISANLHISRDLRRVVNYAQWRSKEDDVAVSKQPEVQAHMKHAAALAISV